MTIAASIVADGRPSTDAASLAGRRVLVTGGGGLLGQHVIVAMGRHGAAVTAFGHSPRAAATLPVDDGEAVEHKWVEGDVTDRGLLEHQFTAAAPEIVVHTAALSDVAECERNPFASLHVNVEGTLNVLHAAADAGCGRFVYISSAAVYRPSRGGIVDRFREDSSLLGPASRYAAAKLWGEHEAIALGAARGMEVWLPRPFSMYGVPQLPRTGGHSWAVPMFALRALRGRPLVVLGDGSQVRDYVHVADAAEAIVQLAARTPEGSPIVNIGTGTPTRILDLANAVAGHTGGRIEFRSARPGDHAGGYADVGRVEALLGWRPSTTLDDGIRAYCEWATTVVDRIDDFWADWDDL